MTERDGRIEAKLDILIALVRELVGMMHESLSRPRRTTVSLSAYSEIQLKRFAVVLIEVIKDVMNGVPPI
jgi:hypothetical protein